MVIIIPARKGSKGIPGKNTNIFCGYPLIEWSFAAAIFLAKLVNTKIICTTDDPVVLDLINQHYSDKIHLHKRVDHLATDHSGMAEVVIDVMEKVHAQNYVLLQPTSPLRFHDDLLNFSKLVQDHKTVVSCTNNAEHPDDMIVLNGTKGRAIVKSKTTNRRQDRNTQYRFIDGSFYAGTFSIVQETKSFLPEDTYYYTTGNLHAVDIDTPFDWMLAETQHDWILSEGINFVRPDR